MRREVLVRTAIAALALILATACERRDERAARREGYSDEQLVAEVQQELKVNGKFSADAVAVRATDGVVTLTGDVASADERKRAEDVAKNVEGVQRVDNQIAIANERAAR